MPCLNKAGIHYRWPVDSGLRDSGLKDKIRKAKNVYKYYLTKHGSWLNLIETLFSKMARTFLKKIRVQSIAELKERILKGVEEINEEPVVHRWKKFDFAKAI